MALQGAPLLLLLAAALVVLGAWASQEQYKRFLLQHFDPSIKHGTGDDGYCDGRMREMMARDKPKTCKEKNTFIHGNSDDIRAVCTAQGGQDYTTKTGQLMRRSLQRFQVTNCKHHGGKPIRNCKYRASGGSRKIVIACDKAGFPVHLEETQI